MDINNIITINVAMVNIVTIKFKLKQYQYLWFNKQKFVIIDAINYVYDADNGDDRKKNQNTKY